MFEALQKHSQFFLGYGGHKQAAGLSIKSVDISFFRKKINEYANKILSKDDLTPKLHIDLIINNLNELNIETVEKMELLQPFGYGNPGPILAIKNCRLQSAPQIIGKNHLKFRINDNKKNIMQCIGWGMANRITELDKYNLDCGFYTDFERFSKAVERCQNNKETKIDYISVCSPNYLHDSHIRFGLRMGCNVICEKPLVLNSANISEINDLQIKSGKYVYPILQLRLHLLVNVTVKLLTFESKHNFFFAISISFNTML